MAIFGSDDRIVIPAGFGAEQPFSAIVRIVSEYADGTRSQGSGVMIGANDVLTAAHVIHNASHGGAPVRVTVTPGYQSGVSPYGSLTATGVQAASGYRLNGDLDQDFGVLILSQNIGHQTGWYGIGTLAAASGQGSPLGVTLESLGYPADRRGAQVYTTGTVDGTDGNALTFTDDMDLRAGQSGSPVAYTDPGDGAITVVGLISWEQMPPFHRNGILGFTDAMVRTITAWTQDGGAGGQAPVATEVDAQWYLARYADVAAAVQAGQFASAAAHFNAYGWQEGRDPNAGFETAFYLSTHADVRQAGVNPLDHYRMYGAAEGRSVSAESTSDGLLTTGSFRPQAAELEVLL